MSFPHEKRDCVPHFRGKYLNAEASAGFVFAQLKTNSNTNLHVRILYSVFYTSHPCACSGRGTRRLQHCEQHRGPSQRRHTGTGARVPRPGNQTSSFTFGLKNTHFHSGHRANDDSADLLTHRHLSPRS